MTIDYRTTVALARAHGLAVASTRARQVLVSIEFYETGGKVFSFWKCMGACTKCDRLWIELHQGLTSVKVIDVDPPETATPSKPKVLPD